MKFYAVKKGHTTGIFNDWNQCSKAVSKFPGADFKAFNSKTEAEAYLSNQDIYTEQIKKDLTDGYIVAYCDGSFNDDLKRYSYGVIIIDENLNEHELCGYGNNSKYIESKNIAGEILAVINAIDWIISNNYSKIKIYHDLEGLSKWANGEWEAKTEITKTYVHLLKTKYSGLITIDFEKVKGHSNNTYNEKVDMLAKSAIVNKNILPVKGDNWFTVPHFKKSDLESLISLILEENTNIKNTKDVTPVALIYILELEKEKLRITLFNTNKLLVQGKLGTLFQIFTSYVFELLGIDNIEPLFKSAYRVNLKKDQIASNFDQIAENLPIDYPENIKILLKSSVMFLTCYIESDDYGWCVFPALRALEGHMKYIFSKYNIIHSKFLMFEIDKIKNRYILDNITSIKIAKPKIINKIEEIYNYYSRHRHTLGHYGDIFGDTDSTRMIKNKNEADEIIKQCLKLITEQNEE